MRYTAQILLYTILPLILVLIVVSVGSITLHETSMRDMIANRDAQLAAAIVGPLEQDLADRARMLDDWLDEPGASRPAPDVEAAFDRGLSLYAPDFTRLSHPGAAAPDLPQARDLVAAAVRQAGVPEIALQSGGGRTTLWIAFANTHGRSALGGVTADKLHLGASMQRYSDAWATVFLTDDAGRIVYHPDAAYIGRTIEPGHVADASGSVWVSDSQHGHEQVVASAPVAGTNWRLIVQEPSADASLPALRLSLLAPLVVLVAAIGSLVAVYLGLKRVIRPLQILGDRAGRLSWGDFHALSEPVHGVKEIGELQRALQDMAAQIHRYQAGMQDYISVLTQGQEEERRRLARELHDETVQGLIALLQRVKMIELEMAACASEGSTESLLVVQGRVAETVGMIETSLSEVRRLIRDLRPIYLEELGLVAGLEMLVESVAAPSLSVSLEVTGDEQRLPNSVELAVYRIAQECLNNSVRHADATEVRLHVDFVAEGVTLTVVDNGKGFDAPEVPGDLAARGHFGLVGIHERATGLGGYLSIDSAPGKGMRVVAFLPAAFHAPISPDLSTAA